MQRCRFFYSRRACRLVGGAQIIEVHHHIALERHHLAAAGNPELVSGERSVEQLDVDMLFRSDGALSHVHKRLRQSRFIAGAGLKKDVVMQLQQLLFGIHGAVTGIERDSRCVVGHQHLGPQRLEIDVIGNSDILRRGVCPDFIGPLIRRVAG